MSTLKTTNVQVGQSITATNNFTLYQPTTPDGTVRLGVGNSGATTSDVITANSSGNVGIGTSSPVGKLQISQTNNTAINGGAYINLGKAENGVGGYRLIGMGYNTGSDYAPTYMGYVETANNSGTAGDIVFFTRPSGNASTVAPSERARIDSSGNLLVGITSSADSHTFVGKTQNGWSFRLLSDFSTQAYGQLISYRNSAPNGTSNEFLYAIDTGGTRMTLRSNGGIANYSGNNVNLSDRREKTNFAPAGEWLPKICAIPVQTFNYTDQNMEEDPGLTLGVVAQDVQAVAPELVMESNWGTQDDPRMRLSIYQTDLQYALMKCIQELKTELDAAKARIAALEGAQ